MTSVLLQHRKLELLVCLSKVIFGCLSHPILINLVDSYAVEIG